MIVQFKQVSVMLEGYTAVLMQMEMDMLTQLTSSQTNLVNGPILTRMVSVTSQMV